MRVTKETNFRDAQGNEIDLHWGLFHGTNRLGIFEQLFGTAEHPMSFEDLHENALPISCAGAACLMPSHEDSLIHVIAHGSLRNDHRASRWVTDAAAIIRTSAVNWERLLARAQKFGFVVEMQIALPYLHETYGIKIPSEFLEKLKNIPAKKSDVKRYYKNANGVPYTALGAFPLLWRNYWSTHTREPLSKRMSGFVDYVANAFGLASKRELPKFVFGKYKERVIYFSKRFSKKFAKKK